MKLHGASYRRELNNRLGLNKAAVVVFRLQLINRAEMVNVTGSGRGTSVYIAGVNCGLPKPT
jgi:hypothetical protein